METTTLTPAAGTETALLIFIDCETIPSQNPAIRDEISDRHPLPELVEVPMPDFENVEAGSHLKDPAKIEADIERRRNKLRVEHCEAVEKAAASHLAACTKAAKAAEQEWHDTCFDGALGHLACIAWAFGTDSVRGQINGHLFLGSGTSHGGTLQQERHLLEEFFRRLEVGIEGVAFARAEADWDALNASRSGDFVNVTNDGSYVRRLLESDGAEWIDERAKRYRSDVPVVVAHYAGFDIRFIWQRAIALSVKVPAWWPIDVKPWDTSRVQDTMTMWAGTKGRVSLDNLCRALGLPGKSGMDGSMVWDAVKAGKIAEVGSYCADDVRRLRSVHRRLRGLQPLAIDDTQPVRETAEEIAAANAAVKTWGPGNDAHFDCHVDGDGEMQWSVVSEGAV